MARTLYDLLGDFSYTESSFIKVGDIKHHNAITLLAIDPVNMDNLVEIYPTTNILNVFLYKDSKTPIDLLNPDCHLSEEDHDLLTKSPLAGGAVCLDQNGWIPLEFMDKKFIAMFVEFATYEQMLAECTYDPQTDYGRLVMVFDIRGEKPDTFTDDTPIWGVYRLVGDPHSKSGWVRCFTEGYDTRRITWDEVAGDLFKSTVAEIDQMVPMRHEHTDLRALDALSIDEDGRLCYQGKRVMYREDYNTLLMDVKEDQLDRLRDGDSGSIVYAEHAVIPPSKAQYVDTSELDTIDHFYENRADINEILLMDTNKFTTFTRFAYNCFNLEIVPVFDFSNAESMTESFKNCTRLENFYEVTADKLVSMLGTWENCKSLKFIGDITNSELLENITNVFKNCKSLVLIPQMNFYDVKYFESFAEGCESITMFDNLINPVNFTNAFRGCTNITSVGTINFSRCKSLDGCFEGCSSLETVNIVPNTLTKSISFEGTALKISNAVDIIDGLPSVPVERTINLRNTPASGVSVTYQDIARDKGWTIVV